MTAMTPEFVVVDAEHGAQSIEAARQNLNSANGDVVLDFADVRRINPQALQALDALARSAHEKTVRIVLRGVNVEIYKVFKLARLASRFSFIN
jgi:anti-anti-sigma regulatory factor